MTGRPIGVSRALVACAVVVASMTAGAAQRGPDGTAGISGTVITTSVPARALARVLVTISGPSLTPSRTAITDDLGRFDFRNLPAGRFTIVAARPPYVKTAFGARHPSQPGTPIDLAAAQQVTGVTMPLALGGVITGVIRDADGAIAPGVTVVATSLDPQPGAAAGPVALNESAVTDDRGEYRIFGLSAGTYVVSADGIPRDTADLTHLSDADMDEILARLQRRSAGLTPMTSTMAPSGAAAAAFARAAPNTRSPTYGSSPIYYPGTPDPDQAIHLALVEGEERAGVDFALQLVRATDVKRTRGVPAGLRRR